jgi:hypothetical protein
LLQESLENFSNNLQANYLTFNWKDEKPVKKKTKGSKGKNLRGSQDSATGVVSQKSESVKHK